MKEEAAVTAENAIADGFVKEALFVVVRSPVPLAPGVNVKVAADVLPAVNVTDAGVKVPVTVDAGVIVIALEFAAPAPGVTVNVEALPTVRETGPMSVYVLNGVLEDATEIVSAAGSVRLPLFVVEIVPAPVADGVKVKVTPVVTPAGNVMVAGLKVPVIVDAGVTTTAVAGPLLLGVSV
ncbi:hypothetical protein AA21952_1513 [Acetobacter oeni LMG 21952]|nr:hypothetical protein AA21952_1513 [Acetobacter oeni LMG 21952]